MQIKDIILILIIGAVLIPTESKTNNVFGLDKFETASAEGMVAIQVANTKFEDKQPEIIPAPICNCNGTKIVKSGDGLQNIPCPCGNTCVCKSTDTSKGCKCGCGKQNCMCGKSGIVGAVCDTQPSEDTFYTLMFTAKWCLPCQLFHRNDEPKLKVSGWVFNDKWVKDVNVVSVDVDSPDNKELVSSILNKYLLVPEFVVMRGNKKIASFTGYMNWQQFSKWHNDVISKERAK